MSLSFSNQIISICGRPQADFQKALSFFFPGENDTVKAYAVDPEKGLMLFWLVVDGQGSKAKTSGGGAVKPLPYEMNFEAAFQFAWGWLQSEEAKKLRGPEPDHDGDNEPGWRVYNESWTHVDDFWEALVGIEPIWAMYGK